MKSQLHKRLEILRKRATLSAEQQLLLHRMTTGHIGETQFFQLLSNELTCDPLLLFNLLLEVNGSECQIDCLLIFQYELILIEIKNYHGDFFIENNKWYTLSKEEIRNPIHQLNRAELLLGQLLKQNQTPLKIKSFVVFVHPEFQLYQAPLNIPVIFSTQLKRFIQKLQNIPCETNKYHHKMVNLLKSKHKLTSSFESNLLYDYSHLKKGITCEKCSGIMKMHDSTYMRCANCNYINHFKKAMMSSVHDFRTLFPDKKITVSTIDEWTNHQVSKYRIRKTLSEHCMLVGSGKKSHYLLNMDPLD